MQTLSLLIPSKHSKFFLIYSNHSGNLMISYLVGLVLGGTVHDQDKYPLSTMMLIVLYLAKYAIVDDSVLG